MQLGNLFGKIMGFIVVIVTLALAPSINQANAAIVTSGNLTVMTGMAAVAAFGAPIIILGLLVSGGIFAMAGVKGQMKGASTRDLIGVIGSVIVVIVALNLFLQVVDYAFALQGAVTGFAQTIYRLIPIAIYVGIIGGAGYYQFRTYRKIKKGKKSSRATTANF